jgi:hypothetical protein
LEKPSVTNTNAGLEWAGKLINFSLDAERQWKDIEQDRELRDIPKVRVNPQEVGSLDAFSSKSIPDIRQSIRDFLASEQGRSDVDKLINMVFSKLFQVVLTSNPVVGEPYSLHIQMRRLDCKFGDMDANELEKILRDRQAPILESWTNDALAIHAEQAFLANPFVPPLPGRFAYSFGSLGRELLPNERRFELESDEPGVRSLNVVWRTDAFGDMPIAGFPRTVRILER